MIGGRQIQLRDRFEQQAGGGNVLGKAHHPIHSTVVKQFGIGGGITEPDDQKDRQDHVKKSCHSAAVSITMPSKAGVTPEGSSDSSVS